MIFAVLTFGLSVRDVDGCLAAVGAAGAADGQQGCSTAFMIVSLIAITFLALMVLNALFQPALPYRLSQLSEAPPESADFLRYLEAITDARIQRHTRAEVLTNAAAYYEAELAAIRDARDHVNIEAYIFHTGRVASAFVDALAEKARRGVRVNIVIDAVGSLTTMLRDFRKLTEAGGRVVYYHPLRWYTVPRYNNRTHRELIVVDARVAFIGGSGIADWWRYDNGGKRAWRDTMVRVEGDAVLAIQGTFAENWLEACGEVLAGTRYFPNVEKEGGMDAALVVNSAPSVGGSTRARVLFQSLLAGAERSIEITTPYFLPDAGARRELKEAVKRGVRVRVIVPGREGDIRLTRKSSRRLYGELLQAGVRIFEYGPAMIHCKSLIIDGEWSVVGSTNFDHRSFDLNDEVNLAMHDAGIARRLRDDFEHDLAVSHEVSYSEWRKRFLIERVQEWFGWVLERQQ